MDTLSRKLETTALQLTNRVRPPAYPHPLTTTTCLLAPPVCRLQPATATQLTRPGTPGATCSEPSAYASKDPGCPSLRALSSHVQGPRVSPPPSPQLTRPGTPGVPLSEPSAYASKDPGCPSLRALSLRVQGPQRLQALSSCVQGPQVSLPPSPQLTRPGTPGVPHPEPRMLTHQPPPGGSGPAGWLLSGGPGPRKTKSNGTAGGRSCWGWGQLLVIKMSTSVSRPRGKTIVSDTVKLEGF